MLVLSRREGERIVIGDDIVVEVVEIRGDKARLGITAPPDIPVHRQEVFDSIQRGITKEQHEAARAERMQRTANPTFYRPGGTRRSRHS